MRSLRPAGESDAAVTAPAAPGPTDGARTGILRDPRARVHTLRLFVSGAAQPRVRRMTDVVVLVPSLLALALLAGTEPSPFERALKDFLAAFPSWLDAVWGILIGALTAWGVGLLVATVVRRRFALLAEAVLAAAIAAVVVAVAAHAANDSWPSLSSSLGFHENQPVFPSARLSLSTAALLTLDGDLVRPAARLNRWLILLAATAAAIGGTAGPFSLVAALLVGVVAAAAVRLVVGTAEGRPSVADVAALLSARGVHATGLALDERQAAGVIRMHAVDREGALLTVKVYGRDAYDNQLLARLWRRLWYRGEGPGVGLSRALVVEHEAFVTLLAGSAGVATPQVVTAGPTPSQDAILVLRGGGRALVDVPTERVDASLMRSAWAAVRRLGDAHIAHLQIDGSAVLVERDTVALGEFGAATVSPDEGQVACDQAQLLATTASIAGAGPAIEAAVASLGRDGLEALLPYIQPAAFGAPLRRALKAAEIDVDELRASAAAAVGGEPPDLVKLRRVTWGSAIQAGLLVLAASAVFSFISGVDFNELSDDLRNAAWGWMFTALVVAQLPRVAQSVATLGTVPARLPFGPVYAMQLATGYLNLALPSNIARMAVNVRFFQRQGLPGAQAIASGTIDSFANNVIQAAMLILLLVFAQSSVDVSLSTDQTTSGSNRTLALLVGLAVLAVIAGGVAIAVSSRLRQRVMEPLRHWIPQIRDTFRTLRSPVKLTQMILGNVAAELLFAIALGLFAHALGYTISLVDLLVINQSVSLFSSFIPVPGGIGVVEGGLMVGLTSAGMPETTALACALSYRIATFYLPPIAGWFALRWLTKSGNL